MKNLTRASALLLLSFSLACGDDDLRTVPDASPGEDAFVGEDAGPEGLPLLGLGTNAVENVTLEVIATIDDAISTPRDLAFNPEATDQLWVANESGSMTILFDPGTPEQDWVRRNGFGSGHFFATPSAIAFGAPGTLASVSEEDEVTQPETPPDFMGPTLWTSDLEEFDAGHHGHLDMLHNSPNSVGIAWERDNAYWVFDGEHSSLTRYDFREDHGLGGEDHTDGIVHRYVEGAVARVPGISSHMVVHGGWLYVADTGNGRVARLDIASGTEGDRIFPDYDGSRQRYMNGGVLEDVVPAGSIEGLTQPSGLEIQNGMLFVSDVAASRIYALTMDGALVDWLDLSSRIPAGSLMAMAFGPDGHLYLVDHDASQIWRLQPR